VQGLWTLGRIVGLCRIMECLKERGVFVGPSKVWRIVESLKRVEMVNELKRQQQYAQFLLLLHQLSIKLEKHTKIIPKTVRTSGQPKHSMIKNRRDCSIM